MPPYFSQGVITPDRKTANLAFGIRLMPLDRQKEVVDDIERRLDPPPGVEASVVGLPVLAAEANASLSSPWRRGLTLLAALAGVFLVLLAVRRSLRDAAVPLIPIAFATGWSGAVLFLLGLLPGSLEVDLNPMSVTLGALVIAISTEFSVLLSSRYRQEREAGAGPARAIELTYASTGAAVLASGATAIAGFAALIASDIRMLRDFGIVTVVDLTVSLLGVLLVLPGRADLGRAARPGAGPRPAAPPPPPRAGRRAVSDDRFEDLGGERRRAEIGEQLAERDRTHPEGPPRRPEVPRPGNKYAWAVGIVMLMVLGLVLFFQTLPNEGSGFEGPRRGSVHEGVRRPVGARHAGGRRQRLPAGRRVQLADRAAARLHAALV